MHYSAKRSLAVACRPSVYLFDRLSVSVIYVNYNYNENSKITWKKLAINDNYNYNEIIANNYN